MQVGTYEASIFDLKGLQRFLGMTGYYRRFIKDYAKIAKPLTLLLRKVNVYKWNDACQKAFDELEKDLTSSPILIYPDFKERFILKTDASQKALRAALCQEIDSKRHVIADWSRVLNKPKPNIRSRIRDDGSSGCHTTL